MLLALIILPVAITFAACGGTSTPPSYEAKAKAHDYYAGQTHYVKWGTASWFSYTGQSLQQIWDQYMEVFEDEYYNVKLNATDHLKITLGEIGDGIADVVNSFINGQEFRLFPNEEDKHTGTMNIKVGSEQATGIAFEISPTNGAMTLAGAPAPYGESFIKYSYRNGMMTIEIDFKAVARSLIYTAGITDMGKLGTIPALTVQFYLS